MITSHTEMTPDAPPAKTTPAEVKIRTWQERTGNHSWRPGSVKHALAEIAELREALASGLGKTMPADLMLSLADAICKAAPGILQAPVGSRFKLSGDIVGAGPGHAFLSNLAVMPAVQEDVSYELVQDGYTQAGASGPNALPEILHYAAVYGQDGPVEVFKVTRERIELTKGA